jgi:AcrR family transcriptional regulator
VTTPRRRGPAPRFTREQLVDAAVVVVEEQGFSALSLRSVARHLGVGPMTLYTYVDGSEELAALVVDRLAGEAVSGVRWPKGWRAVLKQFAKQLDALVTAHPAILDAYGSGRVKEGRAGQVAREVQARLVADGLTPQQALESYVAVHAVVLGYSFIRSAELRSPVPLDRILDAVLDGLTP